MEFLKNIPAIYNKRAVAAADPNDDYSDEGTFNSQLESSNDDSDDESGEDARTWQLGQVPLSPGLLQ
jgi:hypothetical protein